AGTVGEVDVPATLLALAGIDSNGVDGVPVATALPSHRVADRDVYSETWYPRLHFGWSDLEAVTEGRYRFVRAPRPELFDLVADPGERTNIVSEKSTTAAALRTSLERTAAGSPTAEPAAVTADARDPLKALGYAAGSPPPPRAA